MKVDGPRETRRKKISPLCRVDLAVLGRQKGLTGGHDGRSQGVWIARSVTRCKGAIWEALACKRRVETRAMRADGRKGFNYRFIGPEDPSFGEINAMRASKQSKLEDGFSRRIRPPRAATRARAVRVRECSRAEESSSARWRSERLGSPAG